MKRILFILFLSILFTQCDTDAKRSYKVASRYLFQADKELLVYKDDAAWAKALTAESIAREHGYNDILCRSLVIKGKVCFYANVSEESARDDEALTYLYEAVSIADAESLAKEKIISRYLISDVFVNKNRWKGEDIDTLLHAEAGRWLSEGERLAYYLNDDLLKNEAAFHRLRYLRQGGLNTEAIELCESVIDTCSDDNYSMRQQMYDQLTVLYQLEGDPELSHEAHANYVLCTRKQMSQIKEEPDSNLLGEILLVVLALSLLALCTAVVVFVLKKAKVSRRAASSRRDNAKSDLPVITKEDMETLTPREKEIVSLILEGKNTSDISRILNLSQRTISNHKQNIYKKLGVNSVQELISLLESLGWK